MLNDGMTRKRRPVSESSENGDIQRMSEPFPEPDAPPPVQVTEAHHLPLPFCRRDLTFDQLCNHTAIECRLVRTKSNVWAEHGPCFSD